MSDEDKRTVDLAKEFVKAFHTNHDNIEVIGAIMCEQMDGEHEYILGHMKAMRNILNDAIKILGGEEDD